MTRTDATTVSAPIQSEDERFMRAALALGRRGMGTTAPNPSVGCIVVQGRGEDVRIVGRGWTARGGRPHAETVALARAGSAARGATAYVSLEPCSHHGGTPPCIDALIAAGVARVVTSIDDPDPRVAGRGHQRLREAGIAVNTGMLAQEARKAHAGFLSRITRGRPQVILKLAISSDGKIAAADQAAPNLVTGPQARARGHLIRARADAIMVGMGTVRADDPELTCRLPGLEDRSPIRVVLGTVDRLPAGCRLLDTLAASPVWLFTTAAGEGAAADIRVETLPAGTSGGVDLAAALGRLASLGVNTLMVEGGARLAGALVEADLVDEVKLFMAAEPIGAGGLDALGHRPLGDITDSPRFRACGEMALGRDRLIAYERAR
jgi:diaminohydroxyphosphoribosylaminopyrimidine deaminase / 5-amino-6-(5-phosphoribosylamino)uracil reductase